MGRSVHSHIILECDEEGCDNSASFRTSNNSDNYECGQNAERDAIMLCYQAGWRYKALANSNGSVKGVWTCPRH